MLTDIDAELMRQHLMGHRTQLAKLAFYATIITDQELRELLGRQSEMMNNHVQTMETLLKNQSAQLPALPLSAQAKTGGKNPPGSHPLSDEQIAMDCRMTAFAMGTNNYFSAHHMMSPEAKSIHFKMSEQNAEIASEYAKLATRKDWSPSRLVGAGR